MKNDLNKNMGPHFVEYKIIDILDVLIFKLTGNLFPDIRDEIGVVFSEEFPKSKGMVAASP